MHNSIAGAVLLTMCRDCTIPWWFVAGMSDFEAFYLALIWFRRRLMSPHLSLIAVISKYAETCTRSAYLDILAYNTVAAPMLC